MKRSEMVRILTEYLKDETGHQYSKCLAVTILNMCEDAGMRPPLLINQQYKGPHEGWEPEGE
jgi:hypothetical protein